MVLVGVVEDVSLHYAMNDCVPPLQGLAAMVRGLRDEISELKTMLSEQHRGNGKQQGLIGGAISSAAHMLPSIPGVSSSQK